MVQSGTTSEAKVDVEPNQAVVPPTLPYVTLWLQDGPSQEISSLLPAAVQLLACVSGTRTRPMPLTSS